MLSSVEFAMKHHAQVKVMLCRFIFVCANSVVCMHLPTCRQYIMVNHIIVKFIHFCYYVYSTRVIYNFIVIIVIIVRLKNTNNT